jgi:hypothetical protein
MDASRLGRCIELRFEPSYTLFDALEGAKDEDVGFLGVDPDGAVGALDRASDLGQANVFGVGHGSF